MMQWCLNCCDNTISGCLQIQRNQFPGDIQGTFFFKFQKIFFTWQAIQHQNAGVCKCKFVISINEHVMMSSDQCSSLCHPTSLLILSGLPYAECTKNRLTCENYMAKYKIFLEHQLNSRRFPRVVHTLHINTSSKHYSTEQLKFLVQSINQSAMQYDYNNAKPQRHQYTSTEHR